MFKLNSESGFSLIELLVAITIMGVALVPMLGAYTRSMMVSLEATRKSKAMMLGNWKLGQIRSVNAYSALSSKSRTECSLPAGYGDYACEYTVEAVPGTAEFAAKKIELRVHFSSSVYGGERTISCNDSSSCDQPDLMTYISKYSE
jgi:prepilin-type N-terminal cleavage/methylation domain-containing protein